MYLIYILFRYLRHKLQARHARYHVRVRDAPTPSVSDASSQPTSTHYLERDSVNDAVSVDTEERNRNSETKSQEETEDELTHVITLVKKIKPKPSRLLELDEEKSQEVLVKPRPQQARVYDDLVLHEMDSVNNVFEMV